MRANSITFTGILLWAAAAILPVAAFASGAQTHLLTGDAAIAPPPSATLLLGDSGTAPLKPTKERWTPERWAPEMPEMPESSIGDRSAAESNSVANSPSFSESEQRAISALTVEPAAAPPEPVAQALPPLEEVQQLQRDLRGLNIPASARSRRRVYPGLTISNPTGYGADRGRIFSGIGFQSRTRFSGGSNVGTIFGGGQRDAVAAIGFGVGNARESVGLQISYTAASFGGSRAPLSGGLNAKLHKQFGNGWAAAIGGEGIINFGRLPDDDDEIEFNDFEGTYYASLTNTISLREDFSNPFSRLTLTGGLGSGRFRSVDRIVNGEFGVGAFGSAALQIVPSTNLIAEWTGQDLAVGLSVAPFPNFPLVFTPAIRDIAGEGDGDPRFVLGVGVSLTDAFSSLGL